MGKEYIAKTFKSGNSVAMRLPKALGFSDGEEVTIVPHADGSFSFWKSRDDLNAFMNLYGSMSSGFMVEGRLPSDQEDRDWSTPQRPSAAA